MGVQEAGSSLEGDVIRRNTSDEVELVLKRSVGATPNFFVDGLPLEPEAVNGSGHLQDGDGFQLVPPPLTEDSLPSPFLPHIVRPSSSSFFPPDNFSCFVG
jgi:hypothetical protein